MSMFKRYARLGAAVVAASAIVLSSQVLPAAATPTGYPQSDLLTFQKGPFGIGSPNGRYVADSFNADGTTKLITKIVDRRTGTKHAINSPCEITVAPIPADNGTIVFFCSSEPDTGMYLKTWSSPVAVKIWSRWIPAQLSGNGAFVALVDRAYPASGAPQSAPSKTRLLRYDVQNQKLTTAKSWTVPGTVAGVPGVPTARYLQSLAFIDTTGTTATGYMCIPSAQLPAATNECEGRAYPMVARVNLSTGALKMINIGQALTPEAYLAATGPWPQLSGMSADGSAVVLDAGPPTDPGSYTPPQNSYVLKAGVLTTATVAGVPCRTPLGDVGRNISAGGRFLFCVVGKDLYRFDSVTKASLRVTKGGILSSGTYQRVSAYQIESVTDRGRRVLLFAPGCGDRPFDQPHCHWTWTKR